MILLTALSSKKFYLNPDLIYRMEETPDTTITLTDGKTLVVQDSAEEVVAAVLEYRRAIYRKMLQAVKKSEEQEKKTWLKKATTHPDLIEYLSTNTGQLNDFSSINSPIGSGEVLHTGRVDLTNLLADFKNYLVDHEMFLDETFDFSELKLEDNKEN